MSLSSPIFPSARARRENLSLASVMPWVALAALFVTALIMRMSVAANTDVSWLLTAGERWLSGQELYRDIIETNPPIAVLTYVPAIMLARLLHLRAEIAVDALMFVAIFASLAMSIFILRHSRIMASPVRGWPLIWIAFAVLAILPSQTCAQREHIAVVLMFPALAALIKRAIGDDLSWAEILVAGFAAGLALAFKPHFALGYGAAIVAAAVMARRWRLLFMFEHWFAAIIVATYALSIASFFPAFFTVIGPMVRDVYLVVYVPFDEMLAKPAVALWLVAMLSAYAVQRRNGLDAPFVVLLAASTGFAIAFFVQRKGWPYHSYPMLALAMIALGYAIASTRSVSRADEVVRAVAAAMLLALFAGGMIWFDYAFDARPLQAPVAKLGAKQKVLAITAEPGIGHPLVRAVGGEWVSRQQGFWVAAYLEKLHQSGPLDPQLAALLEGYAKRERAMVLEDIRRTPPTVVLVDDLSGDWSGWLKSHPDMIELLDGFERVETVNRVAIWRRKS